MSIEQYVPRAEIALSNVQDAAVHRLAEWAQSADAAYLVAERLSSSAFVPAQFKGKPVELTAAILSGLEIGLSPMAAMRSFDIIQGQAAPRAITLRAVVQAHGHEMVLVESTESRCRMKGRRRGSDEWQTVTWTMDRARALGLASKDGWKKQPGSMLVARATSELARLIASDAILGVGYSSEEVADGGAFDAPAPVGDGTPSGTRRMSRKPAAVEPVETVEEPDPPADESPLLNTSSALAKRLFATFNEAAITERDDRLRYVSDVVGRDIASSSELTDADASAVLDALHADLEQPFETEAPA